MAKLKKNEAFKKTNKIGGAKNGGSLGKSQLKTKQNKIKNKNQQQTNKKDKQIELPPITISSDEPILPLSMQSKWINKQRLLIVAARGITHRDRHLMLNLKSLLPHHKSESKITDSNSNSVLNEICEIRNCNKCIFFENRKRQDLYMWLANVPTGPTVKFLVENVHTAEELRMVGNCLKSSRPLLSFDPQFQSQPYYALIQELFVQIFGTPKSHPKSQPFFDHVLTFSIMDNRIWFRNYQIIDEQGSLAEIGPRFCLNLIKIFDGSFNGRLLYKNPHYISPNNHRKLIKSQASEKYRQRLQSKQQRQLKRPSNDQVYADVDKYDDVFQTIRPEDAVGPEKLIFQRNK